LNFDIQPDNTAGNPAFKLQESLANAKVSALMVENGF